jgi:hypothetical protein
MANELNGSVVAILAGDGVERIELDPARQSDSPHSSSPSSA